jgi:hypothetical protein
MSINFFWPVYTQEEHQQVFNSGRDADITMKISAICKLGSQYKQEVHQPV